MADPTLSRLRRSLKDYRILERIGGGGMGDVFLATHATLGGKWAIKVLAQSFAQDASVVDRFLNEAKIGASLQHPNIIKVVDIRQTRTLNCLIMVYAEGEDLTDRIGRKGKLSEAESVEIGVQILKALSCAHQNKIVHRDLKPSNVRIDRYGTVVVLDFGIARARDAAISSKTLQGERLGTPLYMSPEQIRGEEIDHRSDLYSLGVILYEMVTGENPFYSDSGHAVYAKHFDLVPSPLSEKQPGVSSELSAVVEKLLKKERADRFSSADEVLAVLQPLALRLGISGIGITPYSPPSELFDDLAVPRRAPTTVLARSLTKSERQVLDFVDGERSVKDIATMTSLEGKHVSATLARLESEGVVHRDPQDSKGPPDTARAAEDEGRPQSKGWRPITLTLISTVRRRANWLIAFILMAAAVAVALNLDRSDVSYRSSLFVDAAPYAEIVVKDQRGTTVGEGTTPCIFELPGGRYSVIFTYGSDIHEKVVDLVNSRSTKVREDFWTDAEVDSLLEEYEQR